MKKVFISSLLSALLLIADIFAQPVCHDAQRKEFSKDSLEMALLKLAIGESMVDYLPLMLVTDKNISVEQLEANKVMFAKFFDKLPPKNNNFKLYVQAIFRKVHSTILRNYVEYPSLNSTFTSGEYDCLTATTVFALTFDKLGLKYEVIEIKQHIYMMVYDEKNRRVLIEATDPIGGCVLFEHEIKERIKEYEKKNSAIHDELVAETHYEKQVNLHEMAGLLYFNQAVKSFNKGDYYLTVELLKKADLLYPSKRVSSLVVLSLDLISQKRSLGVEQRKAIMEKYQKHFNVVKNFDGVVSSN